MNKSFSNTMKRMMPFSLWNFLKLMHKGSNGLLCKTLFIRKGPGMSWGNGFRINRKPPYIAEIGEDTNIDSYNIWNAENGDIITGKHCWFGVYNIIMGPVVLGDKVSTGPRVTILGPRHAVKGYQQTQEKKQTVIGSNVWISTNAIVSFGVTIGNNAVIGPGVFVTRDVRADSYIAGNPARDFTNLVSIDPTMRLPRIQVAETGRIG